MQEIERKYYLCIYVHIYYSRTHVRQESDACSRTKFYRVVEAHKKEWRRRVFERFLPRAMRVD